MVIYSIYVYIYIVYMYVYLYSNRNFFSTIYIPTAAVARLMAVVCHQISSKTLWNAS